MHPDAAALPSAPEPRKGAVAEMFIGGHSVEFPELDRITILNPANGEAVDTVPAAGPAQVDQAVQAPHRAFPAWWDTPAARRGELLAAAAQRVYAEREELSQRLTA